MLAEIRPMAKFTLSLLSLSVLFLTGCFTIGPRTVARDRFDYSTAISESWKRQTLLNLIKIRYVNANFPGEKLVFAAVLLFAVVNAVVTIPYTSWSKRRHSEVAGGVIAER